MNFDPKDLEKRFYSDGYQLAMKAVEAGLSAEALLSSVKEMHQLVDEVMEYFSDFAKKQNRAPACRKGCSWCCHQPVFALSYEMDVLNDFIEKNFDNATREQIAKRVTEKKTKLKGLQGDALLNSKFPCPLLENGACMAYAARPVACRIYLSTSVASCQKFFSEPENEEAVPALLQFPMRIGRLINEGFKAALKTAGVKVEEMRIEEGTGTFRSS
jgi:Fe-S-cluster containining protein